jgi:hypothetical protein
VLVEFSWAGALNNHPRRPGQGAAHPLWAGPLVHVGRRLTKSDDGEKEGGHRR